MEKIKNFFEFATSDFFRFLGIVILISIIFEGSTKLVVEIIRAIKN